jgi:hypothetical protein
MTLPLVHSVFAVFECEAVLLGSSDSSEDSSASSTSSPGLFVGGLVGGGGGLVGGGGGFLRIVDGGLVHLRRNLLRLGHLITLD